MTNENKSTTVSKQKHSQGAETLGAIIFSIVLGLLMWAASVWLL